MSDEAPAASAPPLRNIKLTLEYDGTRYLGWQAQADGPSIEAELTSALEKATQQRLDLIVAGRTDAGVHAMAQVVNFHVASRIPAWRFAAALNYYLPPDISVHESIEVPLAFDARRDSLSKRYRYRVYRSRQRAALERERAWVLTAATLDAAAMVRASRCLLGERDFESFRSTHCDAAHAVREMFAIDITTTPRPPVGEHVDIVFHATACCRHRCRVLAGTLLEVGLGKRSEASVQEVLAARDRKRAGITAPPEGLTLLEVLYPTT